MSCCECQSKTVFRLVENAILQCCKIILKIYSLFRLYRLFYWCRVRECRSTTVFIPWFLPLLQKPAESWRLVVSLYWICYAQMHSSSNHKVHKWSRNGQIQQQETHTWFRTILLHWILSCCMTAILTWNFTHFIPNNSLINSFYIFNSIENQQLLI